MVICKTGLLVNSISIALGVSKMERMNVSILGGPVFDFELTNSCQENVYESRDTVFFLMY